MDPVVHFEMPGGDTKRMAAFYEKAFGWQMKTMGPDMGNYVVVTTSETDSSNPTGRPKAPGTINGGFYTKSADPMSQYPSVVIAVKDINEAMKKVTEAGGTVHGGAPGQSGPVNIPGVGMFVSIIDTEGNRVSLLQPGM
jgi:uncharacterized protein